MSGSSRQIAAGMHRGDEALRSSRERAVNDRGAVRRGLTDGRSPAILLNFAVRSRPFCNGDWERLRPARLGRHPYGGHHMRRFYLAAIVVAVLGVGAAVTPALALPPRPPPTHPGPSCRGVG